MSERRQPGEIRDAIYAVLREAKKPCTVAEIRDAVSKRLNGDVAASSVRSYLGLNTGNGKNSFRRIGRGSYALVND